MKDAARFLARITDNAVNNVGSWSTSLRASKPILAESLTFLTPNIRIQRGSKKSMAWSCCESHGPITVPMSRSSRHTVIANRIVNKVANKIGSKKKAE